ncbi:MAG: protein kinase domain-containing protein [Planctomycetaceae bacterium]
MTDPPGPVHGPLPGRGPAPSRQRRPIESPCIPGLVDLVEVGRGGMGAVFRARDERLGRTVAVKVLAGSAAISADGHRQADREARLLTRITHPNIVRILFVTESGGAPAIVMEWIDGPTLEERGRDAALPPRAAGAIVADLARAVAAVHACGIVHRDISPANVLLAAGEEQPVPKLIDFGLARPDAEGPGAPSRTEVAIGTPPFMAPEQTGLDAALGAIGPATDIHGLGALLYWLLSGHAPHEAATEAAALAASVTMAAAASAMMGVHHVRRLKRAHVAITASRDGAIEAAARARASFARLTDSTAERLLARGGVQDDGDRDHLRRIRDEYRDWPLEPDPAAALRFRAAGLDRLATIFLRLSWPDDGLEAVELALESLKALEARGLSGPDDDSLHDDLERFQCSLLTSLDRLHEAAALAAASVARLEEGRDARPRLARHLPGALANLAMVQARQGDADAATGSFRRAVAACDALLAAGPDAELLRLALPVLFNAASAPRASAEERSAIQEKVVALAEEGLARYDTQREAFASMALMGLATLADIDLAEGRPGAALEKVRRRAALAAGLVAEFPDAEAITSTTCLVANQASRCLRALGRPGEAEEELDAAIASAERALAAEPAVVSRARSVAWLLDARAELDESLGRPEAAIATYRRLLDRLRPWLSGPAADPPLAARAAAARQAMHRLEAAGPPAAGTGE